jgi:hypothetical protein
MTFRGGRCDEEYPTDYPNDLSRSTARFVDVQLSEVPASIQDRTRQPVTE